MVLYLSGILILLWWLLGSTRQATLLSTRSPLFTQPPPTTFLCPHHYFPNASSMTMLSISNKTSKVNSMAFTTFSSLDCLLEFISNSQISFINHGASSLLSHVPQHFTNMHGYSYHSTNNQHLYNINQCIYSTNPTVTLVSGDADWELVGCYNELPASASGRALGLNGSYISPILSSPDALTVALCLEGCRAALSPNGGAYTYAGVENSV
jgi:hypothetical protein